MASILSTVGATLSYNKPPMEGLKQSTRGGTHFKSLSFGGVSVKPRRVAVVVRAESQGINPEIRKSEDKVVDAVVVTELSKPLTAYCRCWRSGTFPLCDGSHVKHNKATGDNVGPLLLKKQ
ncbi:CDGSH iron-sulfur domain-containing protein NEET [Quercus lobata]|uniref:CDGSH iron-sulfur domain-containing protein NEET n=1 Tax=Quercus lobata TaxID=97700 RepID=UPI0012492132|nr:CDGSH iron-sulfur domain-containing protein NEET [Quercus lobata]